MNIKKIFFEATDGVELFGLLHLPENKNADIVIISVHGHSSSGVENKREDIIANTLTQNGFAYFCFNNRGSMFARKLKINKNGKIERSVGGASYDIVTDCHHDVIGAILAMQNFGFEKFILQGHSLGCSKILITAEELKLKNNTKILNSICGYIFLSPVDSKKFIVEQNSEHTKEVYKLAQEKLKEGKKYSLIKNAILNTDTSATAVVNIFDNIEKISIATESDDNAFERFENLNKPFMLCYGENDYTIQKSEDIINKFSSHFSSHKNLFCVIKNANHSYEKQEGNLAEKILTYCKNLDL